MTEADPLPTDLKSDRRAVIAFWLLVGIMAAIGAGKAVQSDTLDPDLFWHLRVADQLRTDGIGPIVDRISFSSVKEPWTPYSWLAELGMKSLWDHCGWRVAVAAEAILCTAIIALIAMCCVALAGKDRRFNAILATALGAYLTIPFISFRPVTFAMMLLALVAWLLLRERRRGPLIATWWIVPITVLLTNVHLSVVVVPIWVGCLLIGAIWEGKEVRHYADLLAATIVACFATPMLRGAIHTAWFYQAHDLMVASPIIAEMKPFYDGVGGKITAGILAVVIAVAALSRKRLRSGEWLMGLAGLLLATRLGKFVPILAFLAAPILATTMRPLRDKVLAKPIIVGVLAIAFTIAFARIVTSFPGSNVALNDWINHRGPQFECWPTAAADFVEKNIPPRSGRLINEFNWGGYLGWRLGKQYQVFLDGRTQLYTPQFWRQTYLGSDDDIATAIARADADVAIIPVRKPHFLAALQKLGWQSAYRDEYAEVLIPPGKPGAK